MRQHLGQRPDRMHVAARAPGATLQRRTDAVGPPPLLLPAAALPLLARQWH